MTPWIAACQASLSFSISWSLLKLISTESVVSSNHPSQALSPPSPVLSLFSASGSFLMSRLFTSDGQSIGASASASVLAMNIQGWFPLGLTGLISLQSKGLSRIFSSTTIQKHQFLALSFLYGPALTSIHDYWKNHSFDYMGLCQQSGISAF